MAALFISQAIYLLVGLSLNILVFFFVLLFDIDWRSNELCKNVHRF